MTYFITKDDQLTGHWQLETIFYVNTC